MPDQVIIWRFTDGKPGHENQTSGLTNALANRVSVSDYSIAVPNTIIRFIYSILIGRLYRQLCQLPRPNYLIAAGSSTQLPMLFAHLFFGGQRILLMRPNWPVNWFDRLLIPQHDSPKKNHKILATQGAINKIVPSINHDASKGIILLGGPSKHYFWDSKSVIQQISELIEADATISWIVANSRRTPDDFKAQLQLDPGQVSFIDYQNTDNSWLPKQLADAGQVWVSPDSVSMIYEAVTSGAQVGCFMLEATSNHNRIIIGINQLIKHDIITAFKTWQKTQSLSLPATHLNEAQRAADWILKQ